MSDDCIEFVDGQLLKPDGTPLSGDFVPDEQEKIISSQIANIELNDCPVEEESKPPAQVVVDPNAAKKDIDKQKQVEDKVDSAMDTSAAGPTAEQASTVATEQKPEEAADQEDAEEELLDENAYIAFGPGGDPGPDPKLRGQLDEGDEGDELKGWRGDDESVDSFDDYFEEDFYDDYDDCF